MKKSTRNIIGRITLILFSIILIVTGIAHLIKGSMGWNNYWGGLVFSPFAIFFGLFIIYLAVFRWRKLQETPKDKKGRDIKLFFDDWRKW